MVKKYSYETPLWAVAILCGFSIIVAILSFTVFINWEHWSSGYPKILKWLFLIMAIIFFIAGIKPQNWKPWRYFYADKSGIHFPSECPETKNTKWLTIAWSRVGIIKNELFLDRYRGPSIELLLRDDEINGFFTKDRQTKIFFGRDTRENGYFKVGYSNAFNNTDKTVRILNEYKSDYDA